MTLTQVAAVTSKIPKPCDIFRDISLSVEMLRALAKGIICHLEPTASEGDKTIICLAGLTAVDLPGNQFKL